METRTALHVAMPCLYLVPLPVSLVWYVKQSLNQAVTQSISQSVWLPISHEFLGGTNADEEIYRKAQEAAADYLAELGVEDDEEEGEEEQEGEEEEEQDDENWDDEEEEEDEDEEGDVAAGIDVLNAHVMQQGVDASNWYRLLLWVLVRWCRSLCVC